MKHISIPPERALDLSLTRILESLDQACRALGIPYLLTGAMAREILLVHGYGLPPGRATRDVDFGLQVPDWARFQALKTILFAAQEFQPDPNIPHRIYSVAETLGLRMPVDLVPFGGIETPKGTLAWPPDGAFVMDVRGFEVAFSHGVQVAIKPGLEVLLPNPASMTVMKTLAWKDRGKVTQGRDAIDLVELLLRAEDIIGLQVLYDDHLEIVEASGGDPQLAAAHILGIEARLAAGGSMAQEIASILDKGMNENFVTQVLGGGEEMPFAARSNAIKKILNAFINGLQADVTPKARVKHSTIRQIGRDSWPNGRT